MLKILLPLLILFSMSSLAGLPLEPSYASPDYLESKSVMIARADASRSCVAENQPFERMYIVTGAATQYLEPKISMIKSDYIKMLAIYHEVGWRSTEVI
tara:strand:- start:1952 stop:2248 length:297 start_codon:yes stop_codon:yes gene_type:complete